LVSGVRAEIQEFVLSFLKAHGIEWLLVSPCATSWGRGNSKAWNPRDVTCRSLTVKRYSKAV